MIDPEWRQVPGYDHYLVSSEGDVWSEYSRKILKPVWWKSYASIGLCRDGQTKMTKLHQIVALAFHGPRPVGQQVRHLDGDSTNNNMENLRYGTSTENAQDRLRHGHHEQANKVECWRGHPFDEANTFYRKDGRRECRECMRIRKRGYLETYREQRGPLPPRPQKTHCPAGHPYDEENTHHYNGRRVCRACKREKQRERMRRAASPEC